MKRLKCFQTCGRIKGFNILTFDEGLQFCNSKKKKLSKNVIGTLAKCIKTCLPGFELGHIKGVINEKNVYVIWGSKPLKYDTLLDRIIEGSTLVCAMVVKKNELTNHNFSFLEVIFLGVYSEFQGQRIGSKMLNYFKTVEQNKLIILHPDCSSFNFYLINQFLTLQTLDIRLKDFYLFLFMDKKRNFNRVMSSLKKLLENSFDYELYLSINRERYSRYVLFHTGFTRETIILQYYEYLKHLTKMYIYNAYIKRGRWLPFLPKEVLDKTFKNYQDWVDYLNSNKYKFFEYMFYPYKNIDRKEKIKNIIKEINDYKDKYREYKYNDKDDKNVKRKFAIYIYINRLTFIFNKKFNVKLFYFFDKKLSKFKSYMKYAINELNNEIGNLKYHIETLDGSTGLKLLSKKNIIDNYRYLEFLTIINQKKKFQKFVTKLLVNYKNGVISGSFENIKGRDDFFIYINRLVHTYNEKFNCNMDYLVDHTIKNDMLKKLITFIKKECPRNGQISRYVTFLNKIKL